MPHKILIADDDAALLTSLSVRLKAAGYEVTTVTDSYHALAQASQMNPNVLILDVNMPAGDGFTVQERLKRIEGLQGIPTIYLTGERSDRVAESAEHQGAFAVIFKPFETQNLLAKVKAAAEFKSKKRAG